LPATIPIADARALPDGAAATIEAVLTTDLGVLEGGRSGFAQDDTGGVGLYLDAAATQSLPAGSRVIASGTMSERYGQRTLRLASDEILVLGTAPLPVPLDIATGVAGEPDEGWRVRVRGTVTEAPTTMADGTGLMVDDGSGPVRVVAGAAALEGREVGTGMLVEAVGPLGQRDSSGSGTAGYRILAMAEGELIVAQPNPSPSPGPSASPTPSASPSPSASPTPIPSTSPSAAPGPDSTIAAARSLPTGSFVEVGGVVTAEAGVPGKPPLLTIEDETAGIVIHLPDDVHGWPRGTRLIVAGRLASVYGQLEVRPAASGLAVVGAEDVPEPLPVRAVDLGEDLEARLLTLTARVTAAPTKGTSGDLSIDVADADGRAARIGVDASLGIPRESFVRGRWYVFTGVEGQHASRLGALDGYRIWIRDRADLEATEAPLGGTDGGSAFTGPTAAVNGDSTADPTEAGAAVLSIASALSTPGTELTVEGVVTAGTELLDSSRRRLVLQDATGAIEVLLPAPATIHPGVRLRVVGTVGRAYDAPRLRAQRSISLASGDAPAPAGLSRQPDASLEWRLVRVSGRVERLTRVGQTWRADVVVGGQRLLVLGLAGASIPSTRLAVGVDVTVTGIVRRPYPSATDRRFAIVPRSVRDVVRVGAAAAVPASGGIHRSTIAVDPEPAPGTDGGPELVDVARLGEYEGRTVRVGGLITDRTGDQLWLDDGTGRAALVLGPTVIAAGIPFTAGDAIEAVGVVMVDADAAVLRVDDPAGLILAGASGPVVAVTAAVPPGGEVVRAATDDHLLPAAGRDSSAGTEAYVGGLALLALLLMSGWAVRRGMLRRASDATIRRRLAAIPAPVSRSHQADLGRTSPSGPSRMGRSS
jgi:hypothetical protein